MSCGTRDESKTEGDRWFWLAMDTTFLDIPICVLANRNRVTPWLFWIRIQGRLKWLHLIVRPTLAQPVFNNKE